MYFHQSHAEEFFLCAFNKREVFAAEENSDFHGRPIFMNLFDESFPVLVFEGSLSIEIAL